MTMLDASLARLASARIQITTLLDNLLGMLVYGIKNISVNLFNVLAALAIRAYNFVAAILRPIFTPILGLLNSMNAKVIDMLRPLTVRFPFLNRLAAPFARLNPALSTVLQSLLIINSAPYVIASVASAAVFGYTMLTEYLVAWAMTARDFFRSYKHRIRDLFDEAKHQFAADRNANDSRLNILANGVGKGAGFALAAFKSSVLLGVKLLLGAVVSPIDAWKPAVKASKFTWSSVITHPLAQIIRNPWRRLMGRDTEITNSYDDTYGMLRVLNRRVYNVEGGLQLVMRDVRGVEGDVQQVRTTSAGLATKTEQLQTELRTNAAELSNLSKDVNKRFVRAFEHVQSVEAGLGRLRGEVESNGQQGSRIGNFLGTAVNALVGGGDQIANAQESEENVAGLERQSPNNNGRPNHNQLG